MYVSDWKKWTKRKKQATLIFFFIGLGLMGTMERTNSFIHGLFGLGFGFIALLIMLSITEQGWNS